MNGTFDKKHWVRYINAETRTCVVTCYNSVAEFTSDEY